jgi:hypothetical protein
MHTARAGRDAREPRELLETGDTIAHQDSAKAQSQDDIVHTRKHGAGDSTANGKCRYLPEAKFVGHSPHTE